MLSRVLDAVCQIVAPETVILVKSSEQLLPRIDWPVRITTDRVPAQGPLEGMAAGFRVCAPETRCVFVTSCDTPFLQATFIEAMFESVGSAEIAIPVDGEQLHPLAGVYQPRLLPHVEQLLIRDRRSPRALFELVPPRLIPVESLRRVDPQLLSLMNVNHPDDYANALSRISGDGGSH